MYKVLIIDDSSLDRILLKALIGKQYKIIESENAESGLKKIVTEKPDCIILDYNMPKFDGFQLLHKIYETIESPAIIFVSGAMPDSIRRNAKALGAVVCMEKNEFLIDPCGIISEAINKVAEKC